MFTCYRTADSSRRDACLRGHTGGCDPQTRPADVAFLPWPAVYPIPAVDLLALTLARFNVGMPASFPEIGIWLLVVSLVGGM